MNKYLALAKKYWWAIALVAIAGIAIWKKDAIAKLLGGDKGTDKETTDKDTTTPTTTTTTPVVGSGTTQLTVLKRESKGEEVKELQRLLNAELIFLKANPSVPAPYLQAPLLVESIAPLVVDGSFGDRTESVLNSLAGVKETTLAAVRLKLQHLKPDVLRAVTTAMQDPIAQMNSK